MKKLLVVTAHPDDEAFGPGGTIAFYAKQGVEVHVLCATRGEAGQTDQEFRVQNSELRMNGKEIGMVRENELRTSAKILGVQQVDFLDFTDGTLCNALYHRLAENIQQKIQAFAPHVVLTFEPRGVSGHLDHIAVGLTTTYAFLHTTRRTPHSLQRNAPHSGVCNPSWRGSDW